MGRKRTRGELRKGGRKREGAANAGGFHLFTGGGQVDVLGK